MRFTTPGLAGVVLVDRAASEGLTGIGSFGMNESTVTRVYELDNTGLGSHIHYEVIKSLLGYPTVKTGTAGRKYISRVAPHYINRYLQTNVPNGWFLWAGKCGLKGRKPSGNVVQLDGADYPIYDRYEYTVEYGSAPWEVKDDGQINASSGVPDESYWERYISKVAKPAGESFSLPTSMTSGTPPVTVFSYSYVTSGTPPVESSLSKLLANCNLQVTWHQVPEDGVPSMFVNPTLTEPGAIDKYLGKVNHSTFNYYPQGTLLLLGVQMTPHRSPFGNRIFDICYMFKYFQPVGGAGHQFSFRPLSNGWLEVTTDGITNLSLLTPGKSIFDFGNFNNLFRPPPGYAPLF